jgi:hypothetical protein
MTRLALCATALLLMFSGDDSKILPWRSDTAPQPSALAGARVPVLPDLGDPQQSLPLPPSKNQAQGQPPAKKKDGPLDQYAELSLVRFVDGEYAHAVKSLPSGKNGVILHPDQPLNEEMLKRELMSHGATINPGDQVQITGLQFKKTEIVVFINGGGVKRGSWKDHLSLSGSGLPGITTSSDMPKREQQGLGSTVYIEFGKPIPNLTPEELKSLLSPVLNFEHERSPAVQWVDTLTPEMQKAITEKRAIVGMTHEMVEAALGKPEKKIRERNNEGYETEDWIYGQPPARTIFVTFVGDKVSRIQQFPKDPVAMR